MAASDNIVLVDSTAAARTITLPAPTNGRILYIKDVAGTSATNNITINPFAAETIDGAASYVLSANYGSIELTSDGTNWSVIADARVAASVVNAINQLTGDVTAGPATGSQSEAATVAKIQGTTVSGTTGSGNVVFSASPTLTGTITAAAANFSGAISASNFSGSSSGTNTGDQTITLTGDVTGSGTGSFAATVAKIAGTTVSGTTGSGNVVFSASPTLTGTITAAAANFSGAISASNFSGSSSGTNTGDVTLAAIGSSPNANAASLSGQVLNLQPASASFGGVVTTLTQTFAGDKTFTGNTLIAQATASQATIGIAGSSAQHQINGGLVVTTNTVSANYSIV